MKNQHSTSVQYPHDEESAPLKQPATESAPHYYAPHPSNPTEYRGTTVPGYLVLEPTPEQIERCLPCCGIGLGRFLFIIGFFLASIPWYVGVVMLVCIKHDHRERIGLVCCTIAAIFSLLPVTMSFEHTIMRRES
ncbi:hypothetical protein KP509_11G059100 [Ceratopteris richardii]|uniref:60S ribosomal protein L18a-like protein n=1 Tax=Ceratopteris richardii TaxID=49495 RepID=A0A8T2TYI8_CERRI|nr:hypothetical protein KP509_11G059100 [Ceratopteris richardii]